MKRQMLAPLNQVGLFDGMTVARAGDTGFRQLDHFVQIGRHGIPILTQQGIDLARPELLGIDPNRLKKTRRTVRRKRIVKIKNQGNDIRHTVDSQGGG